jgi:hypothetical protein
VQLLSNMLVLTWHPHTEDLAQARAMLAKFLEVRGATWPCPHRAALERAA